ncbi:MAG TPA: ATP phosphoribosyltransferase [Devosia sp.]|nr:ATP phosphoribosyltransferase [Devosia sp.]
MNEIILAVPSKGRLEEQSCKVFADAGLAIERPGGARSYQGNIAGHPDIVVRFLSAGEIARELVRGNLDMGITGTDLIHEASQNGAEKVNIARALGFGQADVVIAVPGVWLDVSTMSDLSDVAADFSSRHGRWLRVATKYVNLTRRFFAAHGIAEYKIVQSLGATEAAPASGAADLIVDITSTGSTLRANGLRVLEDGVILKSEASLVVSHNRQFGEQQQVLLERVLAAFAN